MNFITKISTFGRFSIKDSQNEVVIKQRNYIGILINLLILTFLLLFLIFQIHYIGIESLSINSPKDLIGIIVLPILFYTLIKNIFILSKEQKLKIDRVKRLIIHDGFELKADRINYADLGKDYHLKGYKYYIIIYLKVGDGTFEVEMDDATKEITGENIFLPTFYSKGLMLLITNEINKLTTKRKIIENKTEIHEFLSIAYLLFIVSLLSFVVYLLIKHL